MSQGGGSSSFMNSNEETMGGSQSRSSSYNNMNESEDVRNSTKNKRTFNETTEENEYNASGGSRSGGGGRSGQQFMQGEMVEYYDESSGPEMQRIIRIMEGVVEDKLEDLSSALGVTGPEFKSSYHLIPRRTLNVLLRHKDEYGTPEYAKEYSQAYADLVGIYGKDAPIALGLIDNIIRLARDKNKPLKIVQKTETRHVKLSVPVPPKPGDDKIFERKMVKVRPPPRREMKDFVIQTPVTYVTSLPNNKPANQGSDGKTVQIIRV